MRDRQHRQTRLGIVLDAVQRQRPEVRRGPGKNDQHQQQRLGRHLAGHRSPAQQRRHGAGQSTNDDVLRRQRLEDDGVDHCIANEGGQGEPHGERVHLLMQQPQSDTTNQYGKAQGLPGVEQATGQRSPLGAGHAGVDLLLHQTVHGGGGTSHHPDTQRRCQQQGQRHHARGGEEHADDSTEHDQRHHAWLGQGMKLAQRGKQGGRLSEAEHGRSSPKNYCKSLI